MVKSHFDFAALDVPRPKRLGAVLCSTRVFFCRKGSQGHDILWGRGRKGSYVLPCYLCHVSPSCHITLLMCINAAPFEANSYLFR